MILRVEKKIKDGRGITPLRILLETVDKVNFWKEITKQTENNRLDELDHDIFYFSSCFNNARKWKIPQNSAHLVVTQEPRVQFFAYVICEHLVGVTVKCSVILPYYGWL